jgi:hypothetical protein
VAEIRDAEDREHAVRAVDAFAHEYGRSGPRPSPRSSTMSSRCWRSSTFPPSTGCTSRPPTRSSPASPRSGCGPRSPRAPAAVPPAWPWPSS